MNVADLYLVFRYWHDDYPQDQVENDSDGKPVYMGIGQKGALTSANLWIIRKLEYTNGYYTGSKTSAANVAWDDRAGLSYS